MSLITVALVASALWIGSFLVYLYTSNQHERIERDIERVRALLEEREQLPQ